MIFSHNRTELRKFFQSCWQKHQSTVMLTEPLTALETQLIDIIQMHPEYHSLFNQPNILDTEWFPEQGETNPFLHMGMHLAIQEQLMIDQPQGIRAVTQKLLTKIPDPHEVEHQMIDCLAQAMWIAQRDQTEADMPAYLECLRRL